MKEAIRNYLAEDVGNGDITTDSIVPADHRSEASIIAKEECVVAGHGFAQEVFATLDPDGSYDALIRDGEVAKRGTIVATVKARTRAILTGERVALNIFQRLSGIATATRAFVEAVEGTNVRILDTRKTSPGMRAMEKYAVRMGGGENHRFGLYDMALVKENHIAIAGSIGEAVARIRKRGTVAVEVEVRNMEELREALEEGVERIMLDNWKDGEIGRAVTLVNGRAPIEVSGNMTVERAREVAHMGIDLISVGSITHSFKSADLSLLIR